MLAIDLLNRYIREHPYGLAPRSQVMLRCTLSQYIRFCGACGLSIFACDQANAWLDDMRQRRLAPDTLRTQRTNLLCVWWWGFREQHLSEPPLRLRKLRPIRRSPQAWTVDEVRQLIATAETFPRRSVWTASLVRAGYDSALRLGDLLELAVGQVNCCAIRLTQHKTGAPILVHLRPETMAAIAQQTAGRTVGDLVWPLWGRREAFYKHFRHVVAAAGIRPGTFRWLRKTAATQLERVAPGQATPLLGHASRATTEAWYIDRSQLDRPPLPPL